MAVPTGTGPEDDAERGNGKEKGEKCRAKMGQEPEKAKGEGKGKR